MRARAFLCVAITALTFFALAAPGGASVTTFNVAADPVTCATLTGKMVFATPLHFTVPVGNLGNPVAVTTKGTMKGCTDSNQPAVNMFKGTFEQTFTAPSDECYNLFGLGPNSGSLTAASSTLKWIPATGQDFAPKTLVGSALQRITTGVPTVWSKNGNVSLSTEFLSGAQFVYLTIETDTQAGMFGAGSFLDFLVQEDSGALFADCASTAGLKSITIGLGELESFGG